MHSPKSVGLFVFPIMNHGQSDESKRFLQHLKSSNEIDSSELRCIFPLRMRELSGSGQQMSDAVIGAVGPKYINILVPSQKAHTLESHL